MDLVDEKRASLYRGRCPTDKRLSVFEFIEPAAWHLLLRETTFHSQVLMESTYVYRNRAGRVSVGFVSRSPSRDSSWMSDRDSQFSRQTHSYPANSIISSRVAQRWSPRMRLQSFMPQVLCVYWRKYRSLIIHVINVDICFSISKIDIYFRKCLKVKELICISTNFLYFFQLFKKLEKVCIKIIK